MIFHLMQYNCTTIISIILNYNYNYGSDNMSNNVQNIVTTFS